MRGVLVIGVDDPHVIPLLDEVSCSMLVARVR